MISPRTLATCLPLACSMSLPRQLDAFQRGRQRQHKIGVPDPHQEAVDDRQGQRQAQGDAGSLAGLAGDVDGSAQGFHAAPDHVHPHSPAGDIGDLLGRRKAGRQDEGEDLGLGELGVGGHQTFLDGTLAHRRGIDAAAVVGHTDQDARRPSAAPKDEWWRCARFAAARRVSGGSMP